MIEFNWFEGYVRKHFRIYMVLRSLAPFICKYVDLEHGFSILKWVKIPNESLVAVDVGCNDGTSIRMIKRYFPDIRIVAIDPICKPKLKVTNLEYMQIALGKSTSTREISVPIVRGHRLTQYSSFEVQNLLNSVAHDTQINPSEISIETRLISLQTLDSLDVEPFFIKIDVEGAELDVLEGSKKTIQRFGPIVLLEIQNQQKYTEIKEFFDIFDYVNLDTELKKCQNGKLRRNDSFNPRFRNYIWMPSNHENNWLKF